MNFDFWGRRNVVSLVVITRMNQELAPVIYILRLKRYNLPIYDKDEYNLFHYLLTDVEKYNFNQFRFSKMRIELISVCFYNS